MILSSLGETYPKEQDFLVDGPHRVFFWPLGSCGLQNFPASSLLDQDLGPPAKAFKSTAVAFLPV